MSKVNYNPPVGLDLVGNYRGKDAASRGVHDSLYAKAIVIENEKKQKAAFLSVDICKIPKETVTMMRSYIASHSDIDAGNIMIMATHTHSGPRAEIDAPQAMEYLTKAASAVVIANKKLVPGSMAFGRTQENGVSFNRRLKYKDGKTHMSWEKLNPDSVIVPLGPKDPELITCWLGQEGKLTGNIINFGCHPTTLTGNNWLYSADFPGFMSKELMDAQGEDFISVFFNGCCGNVTQVNYKVGFIDTFEECQRIGKVLGRASLKTKEKREDIKGTEIAVSREWVPLKRMTITQEQYKWAERIMEEVKKEGKPPLQPDGIPNAQFAEQWISMYKTQNTIDSLEVMVVCIGNSAFVGLPGEMFSEFGMHIKGQSPFENTLVMGLANDARKYFPTKVSFSQGPEGFTPMITGYETTPGGTLYDPGSGEKLTESAIRQLDKINDSLNK